MVIVNHHTIILHLRSHEMSVNHFWRSPVSISFWKDWLNRAILLAYIPWRFRWGMTCRGFIENSATMHVFERAPLKVWRNLKDRTTTFPVKATGWNKYHLNRFDSVIFSFFLSLNSVKLPRANMSNEENSNEKVLLFLWQMKACQCVESAFSEKLNSPYRFPTVSIELNTIFGWERLIIETLLPLKRKPPGNYSDIFWQSHRN